MTNKKVPQGFPKRSRTRRVLIKIEPKLKKQFMDVCQQNNVTMSDHLRGYIKEKTKRVKIAEELPCKTVRGRLKS